MSDLMMYHIFNNVSRIIHEYSVYFTFYMLIPSYLWMYKQHYSISNLESHPQVGACVAERTRAQLCALVVYCCVSSK